VSASTKLDGVARLVNQTRALAVNRTMRHASVASTRLMYSNDLEHQSCRAKEARNTLESIYACLTQGNMQLFEFPPADGERAYILGSGPSVLELESKHWHQVARHDSFGFNNWFKHEFVPTHYVAQASKQFQADADMRVAYLRRRGEYKDCQFIVRGDALNRGNFGNSQFGHELLRRSDLFCVPELYFLSSCTADPDVLMRQLLSRGFFSGAGSSLPLPKLGATLPLIVSLCMRLGYREIILVGIDMRDTRHFYDGAGGDSASVVGVTDRAAAARVHPHMDMDKRSFAVTDVISSMASMAHAELGTRLFVGSSSSALAGHLPVWRW